MKQAWTWAFNASGRVTIYRIGRHSADWYCKGAGAGLAAINVELAFERMTIWTESAVEHMPDS